jgi:hypothetical protein
VIVAKIMKLIGPYPCVPPSNALERRYALRAVKQRLHQASFREAVITAYNGRCALSGLPEPLKGDRQNTTKRVTAAGLP